MTPISIKYQHSPLSHTAICGETIKVLDPFLAQIIIRIPRIANTPESIRIQAILLPISQILLSGHNQHRGKRISRTTNILYRRNIVSIIGIRLVKRLITLFGNNPLTLSTSNSEPCLIHIVDIHRIHTAFLARGFKTVKPI